MIIPTSNFNNRWDKLEQSERDRLNTVYCGWIIHNLLEYGNSLIPSSAIRKVGLLRLVRALDEELMITGNGDMEIKVEKVRNEYDAEIDHIAYLVSKSE